VDPRTGLDDVEKGKILSLPGFELGTLSLYQPVVSSYTGSVITALYTCMHTEYH
jgi:hypothetical protein